MLNLHWTHTCIVRKVTHFSILLNLAILCHWNLRLGKWPFLVCWADKFSNVLFRWNITANKLMEFAALSLHGRAGNIIICQTVKVLIFYCLFLWHAQILGSVCHFVPSFTITLFFELGSCNHFSHAAYMWIKYWVNSSWNGKFLYTQVLKIVNENEKSISAHWQIKISTTLHQVPTSFIPDELCEITFRPKATHERCRHLVSTAGNCCCLARSNCLMSRWSQAV